MRLKLAATLAAIATLTACATAKPYWYKSGVSDDDTYTQLSECKFQVGLNRVPKSDQELLVAHCMRGKGYRLLKRSED